MEVVEEVVKMSDVRLNVLITEVIVALLHAGYFVVLQGFVFPV